MCFDSYKISQFQRLNNYQITFTPKIEITMRFSSDEEFFEEDSKIQIQNKSQNHSQKKKQKKETMLSKFLATLDDDVMKKLLNYQKLKRPIFQRQAVPPLKITLYEDVLFIMTFKDNEAKVISDAKQIKNVCVDLQSRTKRKQCTIRERVQKKLCKMTAAELLGHVANDKDISFNLKKELTSGTKIGIERPEKKIVSNEVKTQQKGGMQTPEKQSLNKDDIKKEQLKNSPSYSKIEISPQKRDVQIFEEEENVQHQDQKIVEQNQEVETEKNIQIEDVDPSQIYIIFKKDATDDQILMFNQMLIHKEVTSMKQKQEEVKKKEQLVSQLKTQMEVIMHFKNKKNAISNNVEINNLIDEVQKIVKILGLNLNDLYPAQTISNETKKSEKIQEQTADRNNIQSEENPKETIPNEVSQFKAGVEEEQTPSEQQSSQKPKTYSLNYALCENPEYIKLYNSNPSVFEPLLWTEEQDTLVDKFLQDFDQNQKLFNLLIRYKGQQMFVQRCIFLGKNLQESKLLEALKLLKPLNINKLNAYMNSFNSEIQNVNDLQNEIMNVITC